MKSFRRKGAKLVGGGGIGLGTGGGDKGDANEQAEYGGGEGIQHARTITTARYNTPLRWLSARTSTADELCGRKHSNGWCKGALRRGEGVNPEMRGEHRTGVVALWLSILCTTRAATLYLYIYMYCEPNGIGKPSPPPPRGMRISIYILGDV